MKILFLIPSMYGGGAEKVAVKLLSFLRSKFDLKLVLFEKGQRIDVEDDISKYYLSNLDGKYASAFFKLLSAPYQYIKFQLLIASEKPDMVLSFLDRANVFNLLPSFFNYKRVISIRSHLSNKLSTSSWKGRLLKFVYCRIFNNADHIVVPSSVMKDDLVNNFGIAEVKIQVIYNGITTSVLDNLSNEPMDAFESQLFANNDIIIHVGSLSKAKRQELLIQSFSLYKNHEKCVDKKLVILGEGNLIGNLERECNKHNLKYWSYDSNIEQDFNDDIDVYFLGFKANPYKYIKKSDLFILTSEREGFPNVLVESLFLMTPVISTDCLSGPREILSDKISYDKKTEKFKHVDYGVLIPSPNEKYDPNILSDAIKYFFNLNFSSYSDLKYRACEFSDEEFLKKWLQTVR